MGQASVWEEDLDNKVSRLVLAYHNAACDRHPAGRSIPQHTMRSGGFAKVPAKYKHEYYRISVQHGRAHDCEWLCTRWGWQDTGRRCSGRASSRYREAAQELRQSC